MIKKYLKGKIEEWIGFLFLAILIAIVIAVTKMVLGWFSYDAATGERVGEFVGKCVLGLVLLLGAYVTVKEYLQSRNNPPTPVVDPRLPVPGQPAALPPPLPRSVAQSTNPPPLPLSALTPGRKFSLEKRDN
ncbi:MAG: hypothetical protein ACAI34_06230 [Verrucomicrobium sp.]